MKKHSAKAHPIISACYTRRQFLRAAAGSAALFAWPVWTRAATRSARCRVALLQSPRVMTDLGIHQTALREMLREALCAAMGTASPAGAWQAILRKDDRILLKFNRADADRLAISDTFAQILVESLMEAGFEARQIGLLETTVRADWAGDLFVPEWGWTDKTYDFGSGSEQLHKVLEQATAIINVPFLKAHRIAGMSGCLKNLSHALIRRPARYHANACCPFIPDIVALEPIRSKLRLHVMNALRVVYDARADASRDPLDTVRCMLVGTDPVAVDTVGQGVLDALRLEKGLKPITPEPGLVQQHVLAVRKGLGTNDVEQMQIIRLAV